MSDPAKPLASGGEGEAPLGAQEEADALSAPPPTTAQCPEPPPTPTVSGVPAIVPPPAAMTATVTAPATTALDPAAMAPPGAVTVAAVPPALPCQPVLEDAACMPFDKAVQFAHGLKLLARSKEGWDAWWEDSEHDMKPAGLPADPEQAYAGTGAWQGYEHFLAPLALTGPVLTPLDTPLGGSSSAAISRAMDDPHVPALSVAALAAVGVSVAGSTSTLTAPIAPTPHLALQDGVQTFESAVVHARSLKLPGTKAWVHWAKTVPLPVGISATPELTYSPPHSPPHAVSPCGLGVSKLVPTIVISDVFCTVRKHLESGTMDFV